MPRTIGYLLAATFLFFPIALYSQPCQKDGNNRRDPTIEAWKERVRNAAERNDTINALFKSGRASIEDRANGEIDYLYAEICLAKAQRDDVAVLKFFRLRVNRLQELARIAKVKSDAGVGSVIDKLSMYAVVSLEKAQLANLEKDRDAEKVALLESIEHSTEWYEAANTMFEFKEGAWRSVTEACRHRRDSQALLAQLTKDDSRKRDAAKTEEECLTKLESVVKKRVDSSELTAPDLYGVQILLLSARARVLISDGKVSEAVRCVEERLRVAQKNAQAMEVLVGFQGFTNDDFQHAKESVTAAERDLKEMTAASAKKNNAGGGNTAIKKQK